MTARRQDALTARILNNKPNTHTTKEVTQMAKETGWAVVGTLPILGFVLVMILNKKDSYAVYYAKQGLVLGLATLVLQALLTVTIILSPLAMLVGLGSLVLWVLSVINAVSGKEKPTPLTGPLVKKLGL